MTRPPDLHPNYAVEPTGPRIDSCAPVDAGTATELIDKGRCVARLGDVEVLVVRTRSGIFAVENRCPHIGTRPLSDAAITRRTLVCQGHGRRYDLASGLPLRGRLARGAGLRTFDVAVAEGRLWLSPREQTA